MSGVIKAVSQWDVFVSENYVECDPRHHLVSCLCFGCLPVLHTFL